jgi:membrane protein implicated in regulation of membrane protease activity
MFSHSEVGVIAGCFVMFVALAGKAVEASAHWFGLTLPWWEATLILLAILVLIAILLAHREGAAEKRRNEESEKREQMKAQLEGRYPGARATPLSSGHWLLTDIGSGRTITEVTPPDRNLSA